MKIELVKHGNTLRPKAGKLPKLLPERFAIEFDAETCTGRVIEIWPASAFPKGIGRVLEEYLKEKECGGKNDARTV